LHALVVFITESRAIECFIQVFLVSVSIGIIYGSPKEWIAALIFILFPYLIIRSFEVLIYVGKYIKISDDDLQLQKIEASILRIYYSIKNSSLVHHITGFISGVKTYVDYLFSKFLNKKDISKHSIDSNEEGNKYAANESQGHISV
jgi:hypothetical protein